MRGAWMIITGGENVYPLEIEQALPGVSAGTRSCECLGLTSRSQDDGFSGAGGASDFVFSAL